jgi:hypothetical protein
MWGDKPDPKDILGMTPEELQAKLAEGAEAKAKLAEIETSMATNFNELKASLDALKAPAPKPPTEERTPTNFWENPDQAFLDRALPIANHTMGLAARVEQMEAKAKYAKDFQLWGDEINKLIESETNLANKGNPVFYENVVNIVRGRHAAEIEESARKGTSLFTEPVSGGVPGGHNDDPKALAAAKLTDEQLKYAKRFGMTADEFAANLAYVENSYGHTKGSSRVQ